MHLPLSATLAGEVAVTHKAPLNHTPPARRGVAKKVFQAISRQVFPEFLCRCARAQQQESLRKVYPGLASDCLHRRGGGGVRGGEGEGGGRRGTSTRSASPALRNQVSTFPSSDTYRFFFLWLPDVNSLLTRHTSFFATLTCKCRTNLDKLLGSPNALLVVTSFSIRLLSLGTRFILSASVPSSVDPLPPPSPP